MGNLDSQFQANGQQKNKDYSREVAGQQFLAYSPQRELRELHAHFQFEYPFS